MTPYAFRFRLFPLLLSFFLALFALSGVQAQSVVPTPNPLIPQKISVATRVVPPMVIKDEKGELSGFSIDLWNLIARDLNISFSYRQFATLPELLASVQDKSSDLGISAISITAERERSFDFSQPILDAGLQIMVRADRSGPPPLYATLWNVMTSQAMRELFWLLLILALVPVPLVYVLERRNPASIMYSDVPSGSVAKSLWWTISALAGQAPGTPTSTVGRVLGLVWMFVGVVFISYFTATVTSSLTVKQLDSAISKLDDLSGKRVATVRASSTEAFLRAQRIEPVAFTQISEAYAALQADRIDAIVFDAPVLNYHAAREGKGKAITVGPVLKPESYGIVFADDNPIRKTINESLLRLKESGQHEAIRKKWFGGADTGAGS